MSAPREYDQHVNGESLEAIRVEGIVKAFGAIQAVNGLSFSVRRNEIFGLLGPNGAGKTTALSIIEGLRPADAGRVDVLGMNIATEAPAIKARIGVQLGLALYAVTFGVLTARFFKWEAR